MTDRYLFRGFHPFEYGKKSVWIGSEQIKGEWVYGVPRDNMVGYTYISHGGIDYGYSLIVIPETVGQYTGLKDKNGTRIFEGDLMRYPAKNEYEKTTFAAFEVFYHDNDCADRHIGWQFDRLHFHGNLSGLDIGFTTFLPKYTEKMEVIGNIHENRI